MSVQVILICVLLSLVMGWILAGLAFVGMRKKMLKQIDQRGHFEVDGRLFEVHEILKPRYPVWRQK